MSIKAPIDGYLSGINVNYVGQYISSSEALASIVPSNSELEFKGYISDRNIALVQIGTKASIKLYAYNSSEYGTLEGTITYVSPTTVYDDKLGNVYTISVNVDTVPEPIILFSGLSGVVEVKVKERSILDYFLEPITHNINNSLKEN